MTWPATYGSEPNDDGDPGMNWGEYLGESCANANCGGVMRPADDGSDVSECAGDGVGGTSTRLGGGVGGTSKCTRLVVPGMVIAVRGGLGWFRGAIARQASLLYELVTRAAGSSRAVWLSGAK